MTENNRADVQVSGIVMVFIDERGHAIANASDFDRSRYGGFTLLDSQRIRARDALAPAVVAAYSSPQLTRAVDRMEAESITSKLVRSHGCSICEVVIGHPSETDTK